MFKKKNYFLLVGLLLCSCASNLPTSSSTNNESSFSSLEDIKSDETLISTSNDIDSIEPSSDINSSNHFSSYDEPSNNVSSNSSISSNGSINSSVTKEEYNPDGSKRQEPPTNNPKLAWSSQESLYDFSSSFPEGFKYIYGHQILKNPAFYSKGGWKITVPNGSARMGFQTPLFESDLKIEIRFYFSEINNNNNKVDEDNPWMTIYGFDEQGNIKQTLTVETPSKFSSYENNKTPYNIYMSGENVSYLEVRFTACPYKGTQCYNFGIKAIGFKTFPYPLF